MGDQTQIRNMADTLLSCLIPRVFCAQSLYFGICRLIEAAWGVSPGVNHARVCLPGYGSEQAEADQETQRGDEEDRPGFLGNTWGNARGDAGA